MSEDLGKLLKEDLENKKLNLEIENQLLSNAKLKQDISSLGSLIALAAPGIGMIAAIGAIII
jgi:hypothetical protein